MLDRAAADLDTHREDSSLPSWVHRHLLSTAISPMLKLRRAPAAKSGSLAQGGVGRQANSWGRADRPEVSSAKAVRQAPECARTGTPGRDRLRWATQSCEDQ